MKLYCLPMTNLAFRTTLTTAVVFVLVLASSTWASAAPVAAHDDLATASSVSSPVTLAQTKAVAQAFASYESTPAVLPAARRAAIMAVAQQHRVVSGGAQVVPGSAAIAAVSNGDLVVSWLLTGTNVEPQSNIAVVVTSSKRFVSSQQLDYVSDGAGGGTTLAWNDGAFTKEVTVTAAQANAFAAQLAQSKGSAGMAQLVQLDDCMNAQWTVAGLVFMVAFYCFGLVFDYLCPIAISGLILAKQWMSTSCA